MLEFFQTIRWCNLPHAIRWWSEGATRKRDARGGKVNAFLKPS